MRLLPQNTSNKVRPATIGISSSFCQFMTTLTRERSEEANANPIFEASELLAGIETWRKSSKKNMLCGGILQHTESLYNKHSKA